LALKYSILRGLPRGDGGIISSKRYLPENMKIMLENESNIRLSVDMSRELFVNI